MNNLITINLSTLLYLLDEINQAFHSIKSFEIRTVFLDISRASVWHDGLIFKLEQNVISGSMLRPFQNYLSNRKQRVVLNGSYSDYSSIESGVPQGSVRGLVYINDLERNIKSNINLFSDDTMLFSIVKNPGISANDLNRDLTSFLSGRINGSYNFTLTQLSRSPWFWFLVRNLVQTIKQVMFIETVVAKIKAKESIIYIYIYI